LGLPFVGIVSLFWVGFLGSLFVEIAIDDGKVPTRYTRFGYLVVRILLALGGGTLAVVFEANNALTAFYLGASAPIVLDKLAQGALPSLPGKESA
jgi:hypothetical protein